MIVGWRRAILGGGLGLYLAGVGFLGGMVLTEHAKAIHQRRSYLNEAMQQQSASPEHEVGDAPWTAHLRQIDDALARNDVNGATHAWHEAYLTAVSSRGWEGMVAVGDASLRIGEVTGSRQATEGKARWLYLVALFRARQHNSLDGVLRAAEAFAALGDREDAYRSLQLAKSLAAQLPYTQARARVHAVAERLGVRALGAESPESDEARPRRWRGGEAGPSD